MTVSFYGNGETVGSVSNNIMGKPLPEQSFAKHKKSETTGSPSFRLGAAPNLDTLEKDTVSFRANEENGKKHSVFGTLLTIGALTAITIGTLAYAHKYNWLGKIKSPKLQEWLKNSNKITEPCYNLCKSIKNFCVENYNKIINRFKK